MSKAMKFVAYGILSFVFAFSFLMAQPEKALASEVECVLLVINNGVINHFEIRVDCPSGEPGYRYFNWGDGSFFDMELNASGDSAQIYTHDYAYEVGGLTVYTAGINFDGIEGLDYTVQIRIDDRPEETFAIGDAEIIISNQGTTWVWPVEINAPGSFIVSVDNLSCRGLAETYDGNFTAYVEGPTTFDFTNYVKSGFIDDQEDPNSGITIMRDGIVLFSKKISAPMCEAPKPSIEVLSSEPYTRGNTLLVHIGMPENATVLLISTDFAFLPDAERLPKGCQFLNDYRNIRCEQSVGGNFHLDLIESMNSSQETFVIRAKSQFTDYNVDYGNGHPVSEHEVVLPLAAVLAATCEVSAHKIDPVSYRIDYSWNNGSSDADYHSLYSGQSVFLPSSTNDITGVSGSGSFTFTYPLNVGETFTPTLFIVGDIGATCEEPIVIEQDLPDPTCTIDAIEGSTFNSRDFKVTWKNGYQAGMGHSVIRYMTFGDGDMYALTTINGNIDYGKIRHDYAWNVETGQAQSTASLTIETPDGSFTCEKEILIRDPSWQQQFNEHTFLPNVER